MKASQVEGQSVMGRGFYPAYHSNPSMSSPAPRIQIAGLGLCTPIGLGAWPTFAALLSGKRLTDRLARYELDIPPEKIVSGIGGVAAARIVTDDPAVELADWAAREACEQAGVSPIGLATFLGTSKGAVAQVGRQSGEHTTEFAPSPEWYALGPHGYLSDRLAKRLKLRVLTHTVAACASSLVALDAARRWLLADEAHTQVLVLTSEAALTPVFLHSYERLGVLAPTTLDGYRQTPLAKKRGGFVLAEAGAAVVLRKLAPSAPITPSKLSNTPLELLDTGVASEAYDLLRTSPRMEAIEHLAAQFHAVRAIDALHPHATGTEEHDPAEAGALARALGAAGAQRPLYACKGALGHGLGAAGLTSFILACLACRTGRIPPMKWLENGAMDLPAGLRAQAAGGTLPPGAAHAVFAAGFGGHTAGALVAGMK